MSNVKGYKGNQATQKAFESLGWVESSCRSITDTDDGGMVLRYVFGHLSLRVNIAPDGRITPVAYFHSDTLDDGDFYPPKGE